MSTAVVAVVAVAVAVVTVTDVCMSRCVCHVCVLCTSRSATVGARRVSPMLEGPTDAHMYVHGMT